jgi:hypothetical protein
MINDKCKIGRSPKVQQSNSPTAAQGLYLCACARNLMRGCIVLLDVVNETVMPYA